MELKELIEEQRSICEDLKEQRGTFPSEEVWKDVMAHEAEKLKCLEASAKRIELLEMSVRTEGAAPSKEHTQTVENAEWEPSDECSARW